MEHVHSLRELLASLSDGSATQGDPSTVLASGGHGDLPDHLLAEAIGNYADTAPIQVAEHLSAYVMAHSAVPGLDPEGWHPGELGDGANGLVLLSHAPGLGSEPAHDPGPLPPTDHSDHGGSGHEHLVTEAADPVHTGDLDFGRGSDPDSNHGDVSQEHGVDQHPEPAVEDHGPVPVWTEEVGQAPGHDVGELPEEHHHDWYEQQPVHSTDHPLDLPDHDGGEAFHG